MILIIFFYVICILTYFCFSAFSFIFLLADIFAHIWQKIKLWLTYLAFMLKIRQKLCKISYFLFHFGHFMANWRQVLEMFASTLPNSEKADQLLFGFSAAIEEGSHAVLLILLPVQSRVALDFVLYASLAGCIKTALLTCSVNSKL